MSASSRPGDDRNGAASAAVEEAPSSLPPWLSRWLHIWDRESGTHEIINLKRQVNQASARFDQQQSKVLRARKTLEQALEQWEGVQAQHTTLLQTRERWTPSHAKEFAGVLEREVEKRGALETAKKDLAEQEAAQLKSLNDYMDQLRRRYQEEQLWQDKWRIYSTYGTWGLIVLNSVVFLAGQLFHRMRENRRLDDMKELILHLVQEQDHRKDRLVLANGSSNSNERGCEEPASDEEEKQVLHPSSGSRDEIVEGDVDESETDEPKASDRRRTAGASTSETEGDSPMMTLRRVLQSHKEAVQSRISHIKPERIDLPSAALGASVTALTWVAAALCSRRNT